MSSERSLTRHNTSGGARWAFNDRFLPSGVTLGDLLELPSSALHPALEALSLEEPTTGRLLPPLDEDHEVWAAGVTYLRSRTAREAESAEAGGSDVYARVYDAQRPELFFKASGWRVSGPDDAIRARKDSSWTVPEPELVLVVNRALEFVGYCAGNDVSARDIEGENPLYLPQAKIYDSACALGPRIVLAEPEDVEDLEVRLEVRRSGEIVFADATKTSEMKRSPTELVEHLGRELSFPRGFLLMTGTSIVPPDGFSLHPGDEVTVAVGPTRLRNIVRGDA